MGRTGKCGGKRFARLAMGLLSRQKCVKLSEIVVKSLLLSSFLSGGFHLINHFQAFSSHSSLSLRLQRRSTHTRLFKKVKSVTAESHKEDLCSELKGFGAVFNIFLCLLSTGTNPLFCLLAVIKVSSLMKCKPLSPPPPSGPLYYRVGGKMKQK